jgi:hypothetical protein
VTRTGTGSRLALCAAVAALLLGATSCGGGGGTAASAGPTAEEQAAAKRKRDALAKDVETISKALVNAPLDFERTVADCDKYLAQAKEIGAKDLAQKLEGMKRDARTAYESAAERELTDANDKVRGYLKAGDLEKARNRIRGIHKALWKEERWVTRADRIVAALRQAERAEKYFDNITKRKSESFRSRGDPARAQGVLEAFLAIPAFAESAKAKDVEAMLAAVKPEVEKAKAAKASESAVALQPAFTGKADELNAWDFTDTSSVIVGGDGVATFKHEIEESPTISMRYGGEDWEDYNIEVQFKLLKGEAYVNFHGRLEGDEEKSWNFKPGVRVTTEECSDSARWYKLRVEVRGKEVTWTPVGSTAPVTKKLESPAGPFEIRLTKRGSEMLIKAVFVKVLKPEGAGKPG